MRCVICRSEMVLKGEIMSNGKVVGWEYECKKCGGEMVYWDERGDYYFRRCKK